MKHETPTIKAQRRERCGSRYASRLRKAGQLPGIIYGHKADPVPVSVDELEILNLIRRGTHAMNVDIEGGDTETCLVKDLQFGYLGDNVIHVDFARVNFDEEVTVHVHITYVGTAPESLKHDTILHHDLTELTVASAVEDIPEEIKVDLSKMLGSHLIAGDVPLPPGVRLGVDPDTLVASVAHLRGASVDVGEEADVAGESAEPEVITETKSEGDEETSEA